MLPFEVVLRTGESPYRQVVYAATRAIVSGELRAGDPFPSVRELSQALRINPNTAQKVVAELTRDGLLEVRPGIGTIVAAMPAGPASAEMRRSIADDAERLVVEARRLGFTRADVTSIVADVWDTLFGADDGPRR